MSYLSCDMSYKIHANGAGHSTGKNNNQYNRGPANNHKGISGYFQYNAREIDVAEGHDIYGYHDSIDRDRTQYNHSFYRDENGEYRKVTSYMDLQRAYERRIEDVEVNRYLNGKTVVLRGKKALKDNSCTIRPIVLQGLETDEAYEDAIRVLSEKVGAENIIGWSIHRDEASTHCHVFVVPVAGGHSLDQKKVLPSTGSQMQSFHRYMRTRMVEMGYTDISIENKPDTYKEDGVTVNLTQEQRELHEENERKRKTSKLLDKSIEAKRKEAERLDEENNQKKIDYEKKLEDETARIKQGAQELVQRMVKDYQNRLDERFEKAVSERARKLFDSLQSTGKKYGNEGVDFTK